MSGNLGEASEVRAKAKSEKEARNTAQQDEVRALSIAGGATYVSLGRSKFLELLYGGDIPSFTVGRRRLVVRDDLDAWLDRMRQEAAESR